MKKPLLVTKWILISIVLFILFGYLTMSLWNWLLPEIAGVKPITFWQAIGLLLLSRILFGRWGGGWGATGKDHFQWKNRYRAKLAEMSEEDRERFKARMWAKWCPEKRAGSVPQSGNSND